MTLPITFEPDDRPTFHVDFCRSCHQPIVWAITNNAQKSIPVDAECVADGNVKLQYRSPVLPPTAEVVPKKHRLGRDDLRMSHFVTCPQADSWRTRK